MSLLLRFIFIRWGLNRYSVRCRSFWIHWAYFVTCGARSRSYTDFFCVCRLHFRLGNAKKVDNADTEDTKKSTEVTAEALIEFLNTKMAEKPEWTAKVWPWLFRISRKISPNNCSTYPNKGDLKNTLMKISFHARWSQETYYIRIFKMSINYSCTMKWKFWFLPKAF